LKKFRYNIIEKVQFKDLCKIKQSPNQSMYDFMKAWKQTANKISIPKQDLKNTLQMLYFLCIK